MRVPLLAVSSDCHLQCYTWAKHPELRGDSYYSFKQIVDYCIHHKLSLMLAGDVINVKRPDPRTVGFLMDQLRRMESAGMVYFIQGQHEMNRDRPWLLAHEEPVHLHRETLEIRGRQFYGIDYVPTDQLQRELDDIPVGTDVLVAHQVWREHMGPQMPSEASFTDVPHVSTVITGDFHAHKVTHHKGKQGQPLTVLSPGSTYMLSLNEDPSKFFFIIYDDLSVISVPIQTRPYYKTRIGSNDALEEFIALQPLLEFGDDDIRLAMPDYLRTPIWHIEYYDSVPDVAKRLTEVATGKAHLFLRPIRARDEVPDVAGEDKAVSIQPTLEGYLPYCVQADNPIYNTALRLLKSNDSKIELRQIVDETIAAEVQVESSGGWSAGEVQNG